MLRLLAVLPGIALTLPAAPIPLPQRTVPETFLVQQPGLAFLGPDGDVKERLASGTNGALSPDGRWLAYVEAGRSTRRGMLVIRPRGRPGEPVTVPLVWGEVGTSGCRPVWAADNRRVMIAETGIGKGGKEEYAHRVYELASKKLTELKLPDGYLVTDWSTDGKRLLTTARPAGEGAVRIAWVNADGTGEPEFLTPDGEAAYGGRLSPDGRRILYQAASRDPKGEWAPSRLYVLDLATKKRTVVDKPGETSGHCWSPDGSRVAYTWQRSLDNPNDVPERETLLITCDPDGGNRKTVTSRKYKVPENSSGKSSMVTFFWVLDWR